MPVVANARRADTSCRTNAVPSLSRSAVSGAQPRFQFPGGEMPPLAAFPGQEVVPTHVHLPPPLADASCGEVVDVAAQMGAQGGLFGQIGTVAVVFILQTQIDALCDQVVVHGLHHHEGCLQTIVFRLLKLRKCVPTEGVLPFQHEVFLLAEVKEGVPRGKGRSVVGIAPSGQTACAEGCVGEEGGDGCFRVLQQEVDGLYRIVFGKIVAFDGVHRLAMGKDLHPIEFRQPSSTIARASPHLGVPHQSPQCPSLEREVECCLLGHFEVFE